MKLCCLFLIFIIESSHLYAQSSITYAVGTHIEITTGSDVCADVITILGTYSGDGTFCDDPLPVELTIFNAKAAKDSIILYWETETEVDNYGFDVERKINNAEWNVIAFIEGNGNSNSPKKYHYCDKELFAGGSMFFYRLKQIDTDGRFEYSEVVEVELYPDNYNLSQNFPNPFNPVTTIRYQLPVAGDIRLKVYDILGNYVTTLVDDFQEAGYHEHKFIASNFASGIYFYTIIAGTFVETKKMILLK